jgi:outer membrane biosynthesis protein TonB
MIWDKLPSFDAGEAPRRSTSSLAANLPISRSQGTINMTKGLVKTIAVAVFVSIALQGCTTQPKVSAAAYISTKVRPDPANPVRLGENYPLESKRLHEEGVCKVKLTVTDQGAVRDVSLTRSTGYSA